MDAPRGDADRQGIGGDRLDALQDPSCSSSCRPRAGDRALEAAHRLPCGRALKGRVAKCPWPTPMSARAIPCGWESLRRKSGTDARPLRRPRRLLVRGRLGAVCRRHHLHARLCGRVMELPTLRCGTRSRARRAASARLQWPRLRHRERQIRARGRPRQRGAESPHGRGREGRGPGARPHPSTIARRRRRIPSCVPASRRSRARSRWRARSPWRCSRLSANGKTGSDRQPQRGM